MICNKTDILNQLRRQLLNHAYWGQKLFTDCVADHSLHLAILQEPYLQFIMEGKKTIETRFAKRACPPFECVASGDIIILKRSAGMVVGICIVEKVWSYRLDPKSFEYIRKKFGVAICAQSDAFWKDRKQAVVATLMLIANVTSIRDINIQKRDRRGWVVFKDSNQKTLL